MSARATNIHDQPVGWCDCCTQGPRVLRHGTVQGIETSWCAECAGEEVCSACGDSRATCDCLEVTEAES